MWLAWGCRREEVTCEQAGKVLRAFGSQGTERGQSSREGGAEAEGGAGPAEPLPKGPAVGRWQSLVCIFRRSPWPRLGDVTFSNQQCQFVLTRENSEKILDWPSRDDSC